MSAHTFVKQLSENDFYMDSLGRMVIDSPDILSEINGAMMGHGHPMDFVTNGACINSGC